MNLRRMTNKLIRAVAVTCAVIVLAGCAAGGKAGMDAAESAEVAEIIDLIQYDFYPGCNTMAGDWGYETLRRDTDGRWGIVSYKRDGISAPLVITTYAVEKDDLIRFDAFLKERDILSLEEREESNDFMTDYNPWSYVITLKDPATGDRDIHKLEEYRVYSQDDYSAIKEMDQLFADIHGKVLSRETEEDK
ncbi:MAG: hypothetical protein K6F54_02245 [Lachnospiraceae bacterium]|nr:hypothetical protein [Lachnospiraceae bacterium]